MADSSRPALVVVLAGTGTEVGKTWVGAALARALRDRGLAVAARKPAQSFEPADVVARVTDADLLADATGEDPMAVCPPHRRYEVPMAPPMAAEVLGRAPLSIAELADEVAASWPGRAPEVGLVELAGGVRSPATHDGDGVDLSAAVDPDLVVLVADAGLGTINSVRMSADALRAGARGETARLVVHLNRFDTTDDLHRRNLEWLADRDRFEVTASVEALADAVDASLPRHCVHCGVTVGTRADAASAHTCSDTLEPPRFCPTCGRRMAVVVTPVGHRATCRTHGTPN